MTLKVESVQWKPNKSRIIGRIDSRQELELVRDHFYAIEASHDDHCRGGIRCNQSRPGCAYAQDESYLVVLAKEGLAFEIGIGAMICFEVEQTDEVNLKVHQLPSPAKIEPKPDPWAEGDNAFRNVPTC